MPALGRLAPVVVLLATGLSAACSSSPSGGAATPATTVSTALVRFVDVAPDAGAASPSDPSIEIPFFQTANANVRIDGVLFSSVSGDSLLRTSANGTTSPLASITPYLSIAPGVHTVLFEDPSAYTSQGYLGVSGTTPALQANARYTVVLNGSYCSNTLRVSTFADDAPSNNGLVVYTVAPSAVQRTYDVGTAAAASPSGPYSKLGTVANGTRTVFSMPQATPIGAFATVAGAPQVLLPSALDAYDQNNIVPFNALTALSLFIRDGVPTSQNGGNCPKTPGSPTIQGALSN